MASPDAPKFENKEKCSKCSCKFGMFTRKHHCRGCGATVCEKCSPKLSALPQFGYSDPVRVCDKCFDRESAKPKPEPAAAEEAAASPAAEVQEDAAPAPRKKAPDWVCTCNMPLCVCAPPPVKEEEPEKKAAPQVAKPKPKPAAGAGGPSSFQGFGGFGQQKAASAWDLKADLNEQCREAIKQNDVGGVKQLIEAKANVNYVDKTGNSLCHLAALFDRYPIVQLLASGGANIWVKNASGETAVDVAPPALAYKMKELQPQP